MLSKTKISKGYSTVIPADIRHALDIEPGDTLLWELEGEKLIIHSRKRVKLEDLVGFISVGGNAVEAKKRIQRGSR